MGDLYIHGAAVLDGVLTQKGSLKGLVMARAKEISSSSSSSSTADRHRFDAKRLLALTANTLAFMRALITVLEATGLLAAEKRVFTTKNLRAKSYTKNARPVSAKSLALVLAHDLLLTPRGRIATSPAWPPHAAVQRHAARLRAELIKLQVKEGKQSIQELRTGENTRQRAARIPRWVRVNERFASMSDVVSTLILDGWQEVGDADALDPKGKSFVRSKHVSCVLAFHPAHTSSLLQHNLYVSGKVILQDLASCFPAEILLGAHLQTASNVEALDATSAPGNKTSHLSAKLAKRKDSSSIIAMEHMPARFKTLTEQLKRTGALDKKAPGYVSPKLCDFMKQEPQSYSAVTHMLLDPSCSGSGILGRLDYLNDEQSVTAAEGETDGAASSVATTTALSERLKGLASFQLSMIEHAMCFPSLERLAYSTCSIHHEENEDVVLRALASDIAKARGWRIALQEEVLPSWPTRGMLEHCNGDTALASAMIRCVPGGADMDAPKAGAPSKKQCLSMEATNGFFVTLFVRDSANDKDASATNMSTTAAQTAALDPSSSSSSISNAAKNKKRKERAKEKARARKRARQSEGEGG